MLRDFKCSKCGVTLVDHLWTPVNSVLTPPGCPSCGKYMDTLPSAPSFVVKGYAASNGYSKERS